MRQFTTDMQAALDAEATRFCHAWKLIRRDGLALGFTDHDDDLAFGGLVYAASAGLAAVSAQADAGLEPGVAEVSGAFSAEALREADLANGLYDGATLETWLVDWSAPKTRLLLDVASLGAVARGEHAFTAQTLGLAERLDQEQGRRFQRACTADLGDARCGVDLSAPRYVMLGEIAASADPGRCSAAAGAAASGWFTGGRMEILSGANAGARVAVKAHSRDDATATFEFWTALAAPLAPGDRFRVTAGCDKTFASCGAKFDNRANFRGCPHMPGEALVFAAANASSLPIDGGSLVR